MYLQTAEEQDKKLAEHWQANADGILIFVRLRPLILFFALTHRPKTGLFSAAVASLLSVSIQDIRPSSQDTSNFYLANIYQTIAAPNQFNTSSTLPSPPPFSPPTYAVWVNALWFLSLAVSITCALLATLLQQWARRYLRITQPAYSPYKRARIRAFFAEGVEKFVILYVAESLPTILHVSLFFFFSGLIVFLANVNLTIYKLVLSWFAVCAAVYGFITIMPFLYPDSPYFTPITILMWQVITAILFFFYRLRLLFSPSRLERGVSLRRSGDRCWKMYTQGMNKTAEEAALGAPSGIDTRTFMSTFDSLDEDDEMEHFFSGLPGFRTSKVVEDPLPSLTEDQKGKLSGALSWLVDITFSSNVVPDPVKKRRATICAKATDPTYIPGSFCILDRILSHYQYTGPQATDILQIARGWASCRDEQAVLAAQATASNIMVRAQHRDDAWFILASNELGIPESVLRAYAANGDNLSLVVLLHVTRQQFIHFRNSLWPWEEFSKVLEAASRFNVRATSTELQNQFCALWNEMLLKAQNNNDGWIASHILRCVRNIYAALHQGTDAMEYFSASTNNRDEDLCQPLSYPFCNIPGHRADPKDVSVSTSFSRTVLQNNAALVYPSPSSTPHAPFLSVSTSYQVDENVTYAPALDNNVSFPVAAHAHQTTPISPDPAAASATRGVGTPATTMPYPTPETPAPAFPVPPTSAASSQHHADHLASFPSPEFPFPASSDPVLDNTVVLPTRPPLSSHMPMTRPHPAPSHSGSHRSGVVAGTSPGPISTPGRGPAAEDVGSRRLDLPPQFVPLSSIAESDVVITVPAPREPNPAHTGDPPLQPSRGRDDVV